MTTTTNPNTETTAPAVEPTVEPATETVAEVKTDTKAEAKVKKAQQKADKSAAKSQARINKAKLRAEKAEKKAEIKAIKAKSKPEKAKAQKAERPAKTKSKISSQSIIIALLGVSLLASACSLSYCIWDSLQGDTPITVNYGNGDGNSVTFTSGSIAEIAAKVTPGVVSIVTEVRTTGFFGQTKTTTAAGTGMIVTKDGYVLTNKHVIENASSIQIVLDDGTTYSDISIVGQDPSNDVAFIKVKGVNNLPTVELGDSKTITAGQQVIAIGNALGQFQNTITSGIVSGTGRSIKATSSDYSSSESLIDMIQTDAAINAGNSGGPLVNAAGEVIGINTATSTDADGIGFAIPISSVKGMLKNIINNNSSDRAYLGIYSVNITPDVAKAYNLPVSSGAYLYSPSQYSAIVVNSPADKAGLKEKDIITKVNGIAVGKAGSISTLIGEFAPGDTVQLTVLRDGKEKTMNVTLGSYNQ